jgi:hypothetical protein
MMGDGVSKTGDVSLLRLSASRQKRKRKKEMRNE